MRALILLLVVACGGTSDDADVATPEPVSAQPTTGAAQETVVAEPASALPPILTADVRAVVDAQSMFEGWTIVPLAQLEREDRIVVIVWPAIAPNGQVVDDDIIGLTLQRGDTLSVVEGNWESRGDAYLAQLGGEPSSRDRGEGVPDQLLSELVTSLPAHFAEHVASGDRQGAVEAAIAFSRLFAFEHAVVSDTVSELLAVHTRGARIETETVAPGRVRARFFEGDAMVEEEILVAIEVAPNRWVFTDHERVDPGVR